MKRQLSMRIVQTAALLACTSFSLLAGNAWAQILAVANNGDINTGTTWDGGVAPIFGDTNQWATSTFTVRTGTQTWEGQELIVQTDGRLGTNVPGPTLTMNGDLTLDGGTIKNLNNNQFILDLNNNTFNLNSGTLDSGDLFASRDLILRNAVLAGSGTIAVEGGDAAVANRSDVIFGSGVNMSGITGTLTALFRTRLFLPTISVANASFGINVGGSGGISLANDLAVTSAQFGSYIVPAGSYTQSDLLNKGVNSNRFIGTGTGILTVVPNGGDWDFDNDVDGDDLLLWQRGAGTASQLADWETQYGGTPPLAAANSAVPEPTSIVLLGMAAASATASRRRL